MGAFKNHLLPLGAFALWIIAAAATAQTSQFDVELGFQVQDLSGNENVYRSQFNEDEGALVRGLTFNLTRPEGESFLDRFRLEAGGFGASPTGRVRLRADRGGAFHFKLDYLDLSHFNALPGYANPLIEDGVFPGQHTVDRTRRTLDMEVELLPQNWLRPIVGFRWNDYSGPARTTYHAGEDEFLLGEDLDETETELRAGLVFERGAFQGQLIQGWRQLEVDETRTLTPGAGNGNNDRPVLGLDNTLDSLTQTSSLELDTPVTSAFLRARASDRVSVLASYIYADAEGEGDTRAAYSGNLTSFQIRRFFGGASESSRVETENPNWRGELRVEALPHESIELTLGYLKRHRELDGRALADILYLDTITFNGSEPRDLSAVLDATTHYERDEDQLEAVVRGELGGGFQAWGAWARVNQDVEVDEDLAQIVVPGGQEGLFEREIDRVSLGLDYRANGYFASLTWQDESADEAVTRIDFLDRQRISFRAHAKLGKHVRLGGNCLLIEADNNTPLVEYDSEQTQYTADLELTEVKNFDVRLSYGVYEYDSDARYIQPHNFETALSQHVEDGDEFEIHAGFRAGRLHLTGEYASFDNEGALSFTLDRYRIEAAVTIAESFEAVALGHFQEYEEADLPIADYQADQFALLFRWRR